MKVKEWLDKKQIKERNMNILLYVGSLSKVATLQTTNSLSSIE